MIKLVKEVAASHLGWSALHALRPAAVTVMTYHRITAPGEHFPGLPVEQFRRQMQWLKRRCRIIRPDEFVEALGRPSRLRPTVMVTFDDGYRDYHDLAYPILDELQIPALVFVPTGLIGTPGLIWTDAVHCAVWFTSARSVELPWNGVRVEIPEEAPAKLAAAQRLKQALKAMRESERSRHLQVLFEGLRVPEPAACVDRQLMTWAEVRATMPLTHYGGHSHHHSVLSSLDDEALREDIALCRMTLRRELPQPTRLFAYPNGQATDFDARTKAALQANGFDFGFTTLPGRNACATDVYELRRQPTTARTVRDYAWLVGAIDAPWGKT